MIVYLCYMVLMILHTVFGQVCPPPAAPENGLMSIVGDVAAFTCNPGYTMNGSRALFCNSGAWSADVPTCHEDTDECGLGLDNCHVNARCTNNIGSYSCSCNNGYWGNGEKCSVAPPGFSFNESCTVLLNVASIKLPDPDSSIKCDLQSTHDGNNKSALLTRFQLDCSKLHQKYQLYNESTPNFYEINDHKFHKKIEVATETQITVIREYIDPVSTYFALPPGNTSLSVVTLYCDAVLHVDNLTEHNLPSSAENETLFIEGLELVMDSDEVSEKFMFSVYLEEYLSELLDYLVDMESGSQRQIGIKITFLRQLNDAQLRNRSNAEVNNTLLFYENLLEEFSSLSINVSTEIRNNLKEALFDSTTSLLDAMWKDHRPSYKDDVKGTLLLGLFDVIDKTCDVALMDISEMIQPVALVTTNTTQISVQKIEQGYTGLVQFQVDLSLSGEPNETYFEFSNTSELSIGNTSIKMMYLDFNPFQMINTTMNITAPIFVVSVSDEKGERLNSKNFTTNINFVQPRPVTENMTTEMSILYSETNSSIVVTGGNLLYVINFTLAANEAKVLDIKLPSNISNVVIHGKAHTPPNQHEVLENGFEFPRDWTNLQKFYHSYFDVESLGNKTDYRLYVLANQTNFKPDKSTYDMYFGVTLNVSNETIIQELTEVAEHCNTSNIENCTMEFGLDVASFFCVFLDEDLMDWSTEGCRTYPAEDSGLIKCQCNHLSTFSSKYSVDDFFVKPVMISLGDVQLFATFFDNPVVVTVVIVVWVIYFFSFYWARRLDVKDIEQIGALKCEDNNSTECYVYVVCVMTGWWSQAGTTAHVFIQINGVNGSSSKKQLSTSVRVCFQSGYEDWFVLTTDHNLGPLQNVTVWHDNAGHSPHWYLNQIFIKDVQSESTWTFIFNDWLAADRGDFRQTTTTIPAMTERDIKFKQKYNFFIFSTRNLRESHVWVSIVSKPPNNTFTRVQRLTCALCLLLTMMLTNIMFYGLPAHEPEDQIQAGGFSFSVRQFVIGIESSLLMFPVNFMVLQLFTKIKPKPPKYGRTKQIETVEDSETHAEPLSDYYLKLLESNMIAQGRLSSEICLLDNKGQNQDKVDEIVAKYFKRCRQNMLWKALKNCNGAGSNNGITKVLTKRQLLNLDPEPVSKPDTPMEESTIVVDMQDFKKKFYGADKECLPKAEEKRDKLKNQTAPREIKLGQKRSTKILPWWFIYIAWIFVILTCLVSSFLVMLYGLKYGYARSVEWVVSFMTGFFQGIFLEQPLKVIVVAVILALILNKQPEIEEYGPDIILAVDEEYLEDVKTPEYKHQPYVEPLSADLLTRIRDRLKLEWLMDMTIRNFILYVFYVAVVLIVVHGHNNNFTSYQNSLALYNLLIEPADGVPVEEVASPSDFYDYMTETFIQVTESLYQIKTTELTPTVNHHLLGPFRLRQVRVKPGECTVNLPHLNPNRCVDSYGYTREDTDNYQSSWTNRTHNSELGPWTYQDSWDLNTLPYPGIHATYSGGGYVKLLKDNAGVAITELDERGWIDDRTRAVFVECTIYNPNVDIFTMVTILFEQTNVGIMYSSYTILSTNLYHYSSDFQQVVATCEGLFVCFTLLFVYVEYKKLKKLKRREYFSDKWNYVEIVQILMSFVVVALFIKRIITVDNTLIEYSEKGNDEFTSFYKAFYWSFILEYVMAFLVGLVIVKATRLFRFNAKTKLIIATLAKARSELFGFLLVFTIASVAYLNAAYLIFGRSMSQFRSVNQALYSNTLIIFGSEIGIELKDNSRYLGPIYFICFVIIKNFIIVQICVTILNASRTITKFELAGRNKFELIDYMMVKFKMVFAKK